MRDPRSIIPLVAAVGFPPNPVDGQQWTDPQTGTRWVYDAALPGWRRLPAAATIEEVIDDGKLYGRTRPPAAPSGDWQRVADDGLY